ncbi:class C sortase [Leifsonia sp. fls2-241-R2A-40a]|uniref:class C sortase n=1 Tax=Leifsonia sp. fls2-241-R2A-40a TaxID=3040290 RepID=UPI00254F139E|nr:class C sortase [Leifsonia sp. fls2-241-R2A-40a]
MPTYRPRHNVRRRRWRPSTLIILVAIIALIGATTLTYSPAARWLAAYNQSLVIARYSEALTKVRPTPSEQVREAHRYNDALSSGAILEANTHVPTGSGTSSHQIYDYWRLLRAPNEVMSRIQIPAIDVDLPIYHGTSDATLLKGAGHLQGTSLPVGGKSTHAVITAHRGLADATMFTDLDKVKKGDRFTLSTFGKVSTYEVYDIRVVKPEDSATLRQQAGEDLVTLVTCTPLGISTHRILVTGTRILPAPPEDVSAAKNSEAELGFPWWAVSYLAALLLIGVYTGWAGRVFPPRGLHFAPRGKRRRRSRLRRAGGVGR